MCLDAGIEVTSLPGPAACITALTMSGMPTRRFAFEAFLPADKKERRQILEELKQETRTIVLYEAPHRLVRTCRELLEVLGDKNVVLCRELTKKHETTMQTTLTGLLSYYEEQKPLGERVLLLEGRKRESLERERQESWEETSIEEHVELYENKGYSRKEAMKLAAADRGITKREIYQYLVEKKG